MRTGKFSSTRERWGRRSFTSDTLMFDPTAGPSSPLQPRRHSYAATEQSTVRNIPLLQSHDEALQYVAKYAKRSAKDLSKELGGGSGSNDSDETENDQTTSLNNNTNSNSNNNNNNNNNNRNITNSISEEDITTKEVSEVEKTRNDVDKMLLNCENIDKINNSLTVDSAPNTPSSSSTSLNKMVEKSGTESMENNKISQGSNNNENRISQDSDSDENDNRTSLAIPEIEIEESVDSEGDEETTDSETNNVPTDNNTNEKEEEESLSTNIGQDIIEFDNEITLTRAEQQDSNGTETHDGTNSKTTLAEFEQINHHSASNQMIPNVQEELERSPRNSEYGTPPLTPSVEQQQQGNTYSRENLENNNNNNNNDDDSSNENVSGTTTMEAINEHSINATTPDTMIPIARDGNKVDGEGEVKIKKHSLEVELPASPFSFSLLQRRAKTPDPNNDGGTTPQDPEKKKERRRSSYLEKRQSHAGLFSLTKSTSLTQLNKSASLTSLNSLLPLSLAIQNPTTTSSTTNNMSDLSPGQTSIPESENESGTTPLAPTSPGINIPSLEEQPVLETCNITLLEDENMGDNENIKQITEDKRRASEINTENGKKPY